MVDRRVAVAAALALALLVGVALVLRSGGSGDEVPVLGGRLIATSSTVDPQTHLFGEPVHARLDVVYDAVRIRSGSVRTEPSFAPYRIVERRMARESFGDVERLRFDFVLECLTSPCLPRRGKPVEFPRARLEYSARALPGKQLASVDWPQLQVASRIGSSNLESLDLQADVRDLPALSYRVQPGTFAAAAYMLAAVLALAGLWLLSRALDARTRIARALARRRTRRSALQRALILVRRETEQGERDRSRQALERLAAELRDTSEPELARDAGRLAWRRRDPSGATVEPLSDEVENLIAREER